MSLPFFFVDRVDEKTLVLNEETSKHIISVLRMQKGERVMLTDGRGKKAECTIVDDNRKKCTVEIVSFAIEEKTRHQITVAISLIKNVSRFEWFLEKATEIGVDEIIPMVCERTEKEKFRFERMRGILVSAMLQSQQTWLPLLHEPTSFEKVIASDHEKKFIAHCLPERKKDLSSELDKPSTSSIMLIGPEGDFTKSEIEDALDKGYIPVALGDTRLRTETAGIVAAALLRLHSEK
jgi:16S rRNA (uracil1498-N3)-methyltransferase